MGSKRAKLPLSREVNGRAARKSLVNLRRKRSSLRLRIMDTEFLELQRTHKEHRLSKADLCMRIQSRSAVVRSPEPKIAESVGERNSRLDPDSFSALAKQHEELRKKREELQRLTKQFPGLD